MWIPKVLKLQPAHPCRKNCGDIILSIICIPKDFLCDCISEHIYSVSWMRHNTVMWIAKVSLLCLCSSLDIYSHMRWMEQALVNQNSKGLHSFAPACLSAGMQDDGKSKWDLKQWIRKSRRTLENLHWPYCGEQQKPSYCLEWTLF